MKNELVSYQKNKSVMPACEHALVLSFILGKLARYHERSRVFVEGHSEGGLQSQEKN